MCVCVCVCVCYDKLKRKNIHFKKYFFHAVCMQRIVLKDRV